MKTSVASMLLRKIRFLHKYNTRAHSHGTSYVTTPIFYVNAAPHIGHLYSAVIADAICRYQRLLQPSDSATVHLCTGTDEHGTKIQQAAATHNVPPAQYCEDISSRYKHVFEEANIAYSDFIRTTEERHRRAVTHFWRSLYDRGHIYSAQYNGWYCVSDESFLADSQVRVDESTGARFSLESGHPVEWTEEHNYMFRLSSLQTEVLYWLKQGRRVRPAKFEKILFDMLSEPLPDVSVSRPIDRVRWAIPVPGDDTQTIYVWLDALVNYLTFADYPNDTFSRLWPCKIHVIGKDILKFHGIYWPAFLIAAGLEPPQQLFVHSHWTVDGQKMSKSRNNVVDPLEAAQTYTMEGLRYFLLREGVAHSDGNYNSTKAWRILNAELADTLGNLLSRVCAKALNPQQLYPRLHAAHLQDIQATSYACRLREAVQQLKAKCSQHYNDNNFYLVVDTVMTALFAANSFFEMSRPWELKLDAANMTPDASPQEKEHSMASAQRLDTIIAMTMDTLRLCGIVLQPLVPELSGRLLDKLSVPPEERMWWNLDEHFAAEGNRVERRECTLGDGDAVLFKRLVRSENGEEKAKPAQPITKKSKRNQTKAKQTETVAQ